MITDGLSPITMLLFLGAVLTGVVLVGLYLFARARSNATLARFSGRLLVTGIGVYVAALVIASLASRSRLLAPGQEKHLCEVDCHLAYSVAGAKAETLPGGNTRHTVTVKIRFDETTIAPWRPKDASLSPNSRYVALVDSTGTRYQGSADGLRRRLIPGESYTTDIVFEVPSSARNLRLVLRNADPETAFVIGHENSFFHGKTMFALPAES